MSEQMMTELVNLGYRNIGEAIEKQKLDSFCDTPHGQKVEPAMLTLMAWLIRSRYRSILHRHNGFYRAIDEASGDEWNSDSAVGLAEIMTERLLK